MEALMLNLDNAHHFGLKENTEKTNKVVAEETLGSNTLPSRHLMKHSQENMLLRLEQTVFLYSQNFNIKTCMFTYSGTQVVPQRRLAINTKF